MPLDRAQCSVRLLEKRKLGAGEMTCRLQSVKARERLADDYEAYAKATAEINLGASRDNQNNDSSR